MRRRSHKTQNGSLIQADARGRIQLPPLLRAFKFFELSVKDEAYRLEPLLPQKVDSLLSATTQPSIWLNPEVTTFIHQKISSRLKEFFSSKAHFQAAVLYGSRSRGDALTNSDFDIALFTDRPFSFKQRAEIREKIEEFLSKEFDTLKSHQVTGDISISFLPIHVADGALPSLYYAISEEGILLWEKSKSKFYEKWKEQVQKQMKRFQVSVQSIAGKKKIWNWKQ